MDPLQSRLDALEQQMHLVTRRLRWWRGLAGGLLGLAVLTWALPTGMADDAKHDDKKTLEQRVAALEKLLKHFRREGNEVFIKGANLLIVNGLGETTCPVDEEGIPLPGCPNGVGNLIMGYNELINFGEGEENPNNRTGSHNVVVGQANNFSGVGGLVVGAFNTISGDFAVVSGGANNTASGRWSAVSGGGRSPFSNEGQGNIASSDLAVVSGGFDNTASGERSVVSGGRNRMADGEFDWVAGDLFQDE